jgi:NAD(P)-dependent dehydrogenase (short-subunit alcohol dehydrogenase family)
MNEMFSLDGQIAIVTGGLGQLGIQFVKTLVVAGAKVAVFDLALAHDNALGELIKNGQVMVCSVDVTNQISVLGAIEEVEEKWGMPNILVNNAGWKASPSDEASGQPAEQYPLDLWKKVMAINLDSAFICSQTLAEKMINKKQTGVIINIASIYGLVAPKPSVYTYKTKQGKKYFKDLSYGVSKAGLIALTREMAIQWAPYGIRVVALTLGGVKNQKSDHEFVEAYNEETPLGRMAHVDEYNGALLFLASPSASYITGSNLIVDGGWTAW